MEFEDIVKACAKHVDPPAKKVIAGAPDRPLVIGDIEVPCYVLEGETRVFSQRGATAGIGLNPDAGFRMPDLLSSKPIKPFVSNELSLALKSPILFKNPSGGGNAYGYPATILVDVSQTIINAHDAKPLRGQHATIIRRCRALLGHFAKVGIIAVIDEITGYQKLRERNALASILDRLIAKEAQPWTKTFPLEVYIEICRFKKWSVPTSSGMGLPQVIGRYTNNIAYARISHGVLQKLRQKTQNYQLEEEKIGIINGLLHTWDTQNSKNTWQASSRL